MLARKFGRAHHGRGGATGGRAALESGQGIEHFGRGHDLVQRQGLAKHRQGVACRVLACLDRNAAKGVRANAVLLDVIAPCPAKKLRRARCVRAEALVRFHGIGKAVQRRWAIVVSAFEGAGDHLLKAHGDGALHHAALHSLTRQEQGAGAGGAIVVDVENRDACQAHTVDGGLACRGVAIHIAHIGLLDFGVVDTGIVECQTCRLGAHLVVGGARARLGEGNHAHAHNVNGSLHPCHTVSSVGDEAV